MRADSQDRALLTTIRSALTSMGLRDARLVVGVSGGPDSLCLIHTLARLAPGRIHIAHLDHGLRGEEGAADARFVGSLAAAWRLPATIERRAVTQRSEDAARRTRYAFFAHVAAESGATAVATGHTADDQAETVLLRLLRGAGLTGLAGMAADTTLYGVRVIRPLLNVRRSQTHAYCRRHLIEVREDSSNRSMEFTRNRLRSQLMPALRSFNPRIEEALLRIARLAAEEEEYWRGELPRLWKEASINAEGAEIRLPRQPLGSLPRAARGRLLREAHRRLAGRANAVEDVHVRRLLDFLEAGSGKAMSLPGDVHAETEHDALVLSFNRPKDASWSATRVAIPGETQAGPWDILCTLHPRHPLSPLKLQSQDGRPEAGPGPWRACLDLDQAGPSLILRPRHPGDRYRPTGMSAPKKLQDILIDARVPRQLRDLVPILEGEAGILWAGGHRIAEEAKVSQTTRTALEVRLEPTTASARKLALHSPRGGD